MQKLADLSIFESLGQHPGGNAVFNTAATPLTLELPNGFNSDKDQWAREEYEKLRGQFVETSYEEIQQYVADLTDTNPAVSFVDLSTAAIGQLAGELNEMSPETGSLDHLNLALRRFTNTISAANKVNERLPLQMTKTLELIKQLRHIFETRKAY